MTIPETQGAAKDFMDSIGGPRRHDGPRVDRADRTEKPASTTNLSIPNPKEQQ
jgi:hypothetical protein